jgi:tetratricopeptide (TPR) repeat protein
MSQDQNSSSGQYLRQCRADLKSAREKGDPPEISRVAAKLGYALFQMRNPKEGLRNFNEALKIATDLDDPQLKIYCLGIKTSAYQIVDRPTDAFKTAQEIENVADEINDLGVKCDALASQGQILLDNGASDVALGKIEQALEIAQQIDDKRRLMNAQAVSGNLSLSMASVEQAEDHFNQALALARELGDRTAEIGYLGNLGIVAEWKGQYTRSTDIFIEVFEFVQESGDQSSQIQALHHLVKGYEKLQDDQKIVECAAVGVALTKDRPNETTFAFLEMQISAYYRLNRLDDAHRATSAAIELARSSGDRTRELNFLLSLGESYMLVERYEKALDAYQQARESARKIKRSIDEAYLTGRIGVTLAELNRIDEAIASHKEALELGRQNRIPELEGEQLTMLALAYLDKGEISEARAYCQSSIEVYSAAGFDQETYRARQVLAQIDGGE